MISASPARTLENTRGVARRVTTRSTLPERHRTTIATRVSRSGHSTEATQPGNCRE